MSHLPRRKFWPTRRVQQTLGNALSRHAIKGGRARVLKAVWRVGTVGCHGDSHGRSSVVGEARWLGKCGRVPWRPCCRSRAFVGSRLSEGGRQGATRR
jgi:hypothetical protein